MKKKSLLIASIISIGLTLSGCSSNNNNLYLCVPNISYANHYKVDSYTFQINDNDTNVIYMIEKSNGKATTYVPYVTTFSDCKLFKGTYCPFCGEDIF